MYIMFIPTLTTNSPVYSFDGVLIFILLIICTCAYIKNVPRLRQFFLSEKNGIFGALYKGETRVSISKNKIIFELEKVKQDHTLVCRMQM